MTDTISLECADCGSTRFVMPNGPLQDNDIIKCKACRREARYGDIREAAARRAKDAAGPSVKDAFKGWKNR